MSAAGDGADRDTGDGREDVAGIEEALRALGDTGRATWSAGRDASKAFRILLAADVSLARSAFGRTLAFTGVAIAFGASAWLLLMGALVAWLSTGLGWAWSLSLLLTAVLSIAATAAAGWGAMWYFEHTRLQATRRQLARLGIGELAGFMPDAGSPGSTTAAADRVADATADKPVKKGLGVDITPP
ncbi:phage holin family protein [Cognatiluteimonas profundi]|uniref:phage holin family protein n=1 Tax=Cognatiluteimonas profundi TaxID=2594501 RepID=UPI0018EF1E9B|nr:phage holin family protein [Lysobacter profundi]